jgi:hypothetical protein
MSVRKRTRASSTQTELPGCIGTRSQYPIQNCDRFLFKAEQWANDSIIDAFGLEGQQHLPQDLVEILSEALYRDLRTTTGRERLKLWHTKSVNTS